MTPEEINDFNTKAVAKCIERLNKGLETSVTRVNVVDLGNGQLGLIQVSIEGRFPIMESQIEE